MSTYVLYSLCGLTVFNSYLSLRLLVAWNRSAQAHNENTKKLDRISFREAIELSYYGASVIHPKTIKPLQNKGIPLFVKSFVEPEEEGTIIQASTSSDHLIPSFIIKHDQILFSISPKDFSFLVEKNLSDIY